MKKILIIILFISGCMKNYASLEEGVITNISYSKPYNCWVVQINNNYGILKKDLKLKKNEKVLFNIDNNYQLTIIKLKKNYEY